MCSESRRAQQKQKRADKMRLFLSIRTVETQGSRGLKKLALCLPREKSGLGTSSSLKREEVGKGNLGEPPQEVDSHCESTPWIPASCSCLVDTG